MKNNLVHIHASYRDQHQQAWQLPERSPNVRGGFTLLENLVAMLIFSLGLIAIAGIFPSAILLQQRTIDEVLGQASKQQVEAIVDALPVDLATIDGAGGMAPDTYIQPLVRTTAIGSPGTSIVPDWESTDVRSMPTSISNADLRDFYWVPLARRKYTPSTSYQDFEIFIFVLKRQDGAEYDRTDTLLPFSADAGIWANNNDDNAVPGVRSREVERDVSDPFNRTFIIDHGFTENDFAVGDLIVDQFGKLYTINEVDPANDKIVLNSTIGADPLIASPTFPTEIWYAPAPTNNPVLGSPIVDVIILTDAVQP